MSVCGEVRNSTGQKTDRKTESKTELTVGLLSKITLEVDGTAPGAIFLFTQQSNKRETNATEVRDERRAKSSGCFPRLAKTRFPARRLAKEH